MPNKISNMKTIRFIGRKVGYPITTRLEESMPFIKAAAEIIIKNTPPGIIPVLYGQGSSCTVIAALIQEHTAFNAKYVHISKENETSHRARKSGWSDRPGTKAWIVDDFIYTGKTLKRIIKEANLAEVDVIVSWVSNLETPRRMSQIKTLYACKN